MKLPGVVGPTYISEDGGQALAEVCQNWYAHPVESDTVQQNPYARTRFLLAPTPGIEVQVTIADATIEAMISTLGRLFVVARLADGDDLYEIRAAADGYTALKRADIPMSGTGIVSLTTMGDVGKLLMVIVGGNVHYFDLRTDLLEANGMVKTGETVWYPDVSCDAEFGAQADGFFLRLDSILNEVGVSPQFGRLPDTDIDTDPIDWVRQAASDIDTGFAADSQGQVQQAYCLGGDASDQRLWANNNVNRTKLLAWDFSGQRQDTDDVNLPGAISGLGVPIMGICFTADYLYIVHKGTRQVFVLDRNNSYARVTNREWVLSQVGTSERKGIYVHDGRAYVMLSYFGANFVVGTEIHCFDIATPGSATFGHRITEREFSADEMDALGIARGYSISGFGNTLFILGASRAVQALDLTTRSRVVGYGDDQVLEKAGHVPDALWYDDTRVDGEDPVGRMWLSNRVTHDLHLFDLVEDTGSCGSYPEFLWDPLQTVKRSTAADRWRALIARNRELFLLGEVTSDIMLNTGAFPFPFAFNRNYALEVGILAPASLALSGQTLVWVGQTREGYGYVYRLAGYDPQRISTAAVETSLRSVSAANLRAASAWAYEADGHSFYVLHVPGLAQTWVYDVTTNLWHTRVDDADAIGSPGRYRPSCHASAFGMNWVGDSVSGRVGILTRSSWGDFEGRPVERIRTAPHMQQERYTGSFRNLNYDVRADSGLADSQQPRDVLPEVEIDWSFDGGETFGRTVRRRPTRRGKGAYVSSCGSGRTFTPRIRTRTLAPISIYDAYVDVTIGKN